MTTPVVDADGHVLEPPDGFQRHCPARFRDRIWHIEVRADGSEWLHFNGGSRPAGGLALAGTAGMSAADRQRALAGKLRYTEVRPGAYRPEPRLPDMDADGITQAVLYPTMLLGLPGLDDAEFAEAQANAYNEWLAEYCAYAPTRLFAAAIVPTQDMARAVATIRRALGYGSMRPATVDYGPAGNQANPVRLGNIFFSQALANPFDIMECVSLMCAGGVLERFPSLTVLFLEANGGWIVSWLERLDHHFEVFSWDVPFLKLKPSEYFRRQCYISFDPDESTIAFTARHPLVGAERIVWASDYPHPDAKFPGVVKELQAATAPLAAAERARILGENARALYHLPAPA